MTDTSMDHDYARDALAAHVERLRERLGMCRHHASYSIGGSDALALQLATIRKVANEALREEPTTSPARPKAEAERDALAAHVERVNKLATQTVFIAYNWDARIHRGAVFCCRRLCEELGIKGEEDLKNFLAEAFPSALARRDAAKQAEDSWHDPTIRHVREMCEGLTGNQIRHALDGMLESEPTPGSE